MTKGLTAWIVVALAVSAVLSMFLPIVGGVVFVLVVPVAVVWSFLNMGDAKGHAERDVAERVVSAARSSLASATRRKIHSRVGVRRCAPSSRPSLSPVNGDGSPSAPPSRCSAGRIRSGRCSSRRLWLSRSVGAS